MTLHVPHERALYLDSQDDLTVKLCFLEHQEIGVRPS
jgi:hypothetical protein